MAKGRVEQSDPSAGTLGAPAKFFARHKVDGVWWGPNACERCEKWLPPYMAGVPMGEAENYCWGHAIEDAVAPYAHENWQLRECIAWLCEQAGVEVERGTRGDGVPGPFIDGKDGWEPIPDTFLPFIDAALLGGEARDA